jgi:transposase-like protein
LIVARKADGERIGRWNCHDCKSSFNVLSGTIFQKTKVDLQKWFLAIALILNAKKSISSHQLARDLDLTQPTAWYMAMRIRRAMVDKGELLSGIVEADEAYIGGKPRKGNNREDDQPAKRGRGTDKLPIVGAVERGGKVVAEPSPRVNAAALTEFLSRNVDTGALLVTDEFGGYSQMAQLMRHSVIQHAVQYVDGLIHTNTIEGFWSLLKRAWYGTHHHYSNAFALAYAVEACFKYNARNAVDSFNAFIRGTVAAW